MKIKNLLFILIVAILSLNSCVSIKPASNINKAENRLIKLNTGIQNQIKAFPSLVDKAYTITRKDTIYIPADSSRFKLQLLEIDSLKNITSKYYKDLEYSHYVVDSLLQLPLGEYPEECQFIVNDLTKRIQFLGTQFNIQKGLTNKWQTDYFRILNNPVEGVYQDSLFIVPYKYYNGEIELSPKVKGRYQIIDVESEQYNVDIRKNFWQDWKFYPFLLGLFALFYFFGDFIFGLLKKGVSLLRKLVFKI